MAAEMGVWWFCSQCGTANEDDVHACKKCEAARPWTTPDVAPTRIRTPDEAFAAGYNALCSHGVTPIHQCDHCRLTDSEIARLVVLLGPGLRAAAERTAA